MKLILETTRIAAFCDAVQGEIESRLGGRRCKATFKAEGCEMVILVLGKWTKNKTLYNSCQDNERIFIDICAIAACSCPPVIIFYGIHSRQF